ncbi:MAG: extracellular solute-binding protein [Candidatus Izemoplasmatales bacterium]|jgi:ABC-type glycerol-3-phosphate transport system substrate-binding protein|nr:extracellular solute-binding protein [Candidatus Izemoplasmatales bacterium]
MKRFLLIAAIAVFGVSLIACNQETTIITTTEAAEAVIDLPTNTTADIRILIPGGNQNETDMVNQAIEGFNLIYPNISISLSYLAVNSYESTVRNQALAGTLPDIVWSNSPDFYYLVDKGLAHPLNEYIEKSEEANIFDVEDDFYVEFFNIGALNDNYYVIPRSADSVVTFYNKKILQDAGINMELLENGWTWDTFIDVCYDIREYFDNNGFSDRYILDANLTSWLSVNYPILRSYGADVTDGTGDITIDSTETRAAIQMIRQLVEDRIIVGTGVTSGSSFEAGTSPFLFQSASVSLFAERRELKGNIDIVSFPLIGDAPKIGSGIAGYAINSASTNKDAAWAFLNYMISYDGQQRMALGGLNLPSIRKDLADFSTANWGQGYTDFNLGAYLYGLEYKITADFLQYFDPKYKSDLDLALKDLFNNAGNVNRTIEECIELVVRDMEDALAD